MPAHPFGEAPIMKDQLVLSIMSGLTSAKFFAFFFAALRTQRRGCKDAGNSDIVPVLDN
jgi:hypothetical protein